MRYLGTMLERVVAEGLAEFHDITIEQGNFTESDAQYLADASSRLGIPIKIQC